MNSGFRSPTWSWAVCLAKEVAMNRQPPSDVTDDPVCPYCEAEGKRQPNSCKRHDWAYRGWLEGLRAGMSE